MRVAANHGSAGPMPYRPQTYNEAMGRNDALALGATPCSGNTMAMGRPSGWAGPASAVVGPLCGVIVASFWVVVLSAAMRARVDPPTSGTLVAWLPAIFAAKRPWWRRTRRGAGAGAGGTWALTKLLLKLL